MTATRRLVITRNVRSARLIKQVDKKSARFFYKIFPENTIPEKRWCTTHSKIFKTLFEKDPDWAPTNDLRRVHYTDYSVKSPVKSFFQTRNDITTKIFLAELLQNLERSDKFERSVKSQDFQQTECHQFYQPTLIYRKNRLDYLNTRNEELYRADAPSKWFLKPNRGYGGTGITILDRPQRAKNYFKRVAVGFPAETLERDPKKALNLVAEYVLQKGVENVALLRGFKFDIRIWLLFVFEGDQFKVSLYRDGFLRVSTKPYREASTDPLINITNLTYHQNQRSTISKTYTYRSQSFYEQSYPKIREACVVLTDRLKNHLRHSPKGFEIMGLDFLLNRDYQPFLLEINRFIGYPINAHNKEVVNLVYKMLGETIDLVLKGQETPNDWDPLTEFVLALEPIKPKNNKKRPTNQAKSAVVVEPIQQPLLSPSDLPDKTTPIPT